MLVAGGGPDEDPAKSDDGREGPRQEKKPRDGGEATGEMNGEERREAGHELYTKSDSPTGQPIKYGAPSFLGVLSTVCVPY